LPPTIQTLYPAAARSDTPNRFFYLTSLLLELDMLKSSYTAL